MGVSAKYSLAVERNTSETALCSAWPRRILNVQAAAADSIAIKEDVVNGRGYPLIPLWPPSRSGSGNPIPRIHRSR